MKAIYAIGLVKSLEDHTGFIIPERVQESLVDVLERTPDNFKSEDFHFSVPEIDTSKSTINEQDRYHYLTPRRVLMNRNLIGNMLVPSLAPLEAFFSLFGIYDSDAQTRDIRTDLQIGRLIASSSEPYSLLCKIETYTNINGDEPLQVVKRPALVIPGKEGSPVIYSWEQKHARTYREFGPFGTLIRTAD